MNRNYSSWKIMHAQDADHVPVFTANSMNCLTEVLGLGLPGNGTIPAVYAERIRLAKEAGMKVMEVLSKGLCPRDILTQEAFENALTLTWHWAVQPIRYCT